jgi:GNAT superfamily N-acetyltransferase
VNWQSTPLASHHDPSGFRCGRDALDRWLRDEAMRAERAGVSRTTVWTAPGDPIVVAFHAIAPTRFARARLSSRALSAGYGDVPGYLIGRLALDETLHGAGLGGQLLVDALDRIVSAAAVAGGRLIAVDAIDEHAHAFCRRHDFTPIDGSSRLVMKVSTARAVLGR